MRGRGEKSLGWFDGDSEEEKNQIAKGKETKKFLEDTLQFFPQFDAQGLIVCITLEAEKKTVVMVGYMNAEALQKTLETRIVHYWSRSRQRLWQKGETSGQRQKLLELYTDCDQDALLLKVLVEGDGNTCHTGRFSCFYRKLAHSESASPTLIFSDAP